MYMLSQIHTVSRNEKLLEEHEHNIIKVNIEISLIKDNYKCGKSHQFLFCISSRSFKKTCDWPFIFGCRFFSLHSLHISSFLSFSPSLSPSPFLSFFLARFSAIVPPLPLYIYLSPSLSEEEVRSPHAPTPILKDHGHRFTLRLSWNSPSTFSRALALSTQQHLFHPPVAFLSSLGRLPTVIPFLSLPPTLPRLFLPFSCFPFCTPSSVRALTRAPAKNVSATRASGVAIREGSAPWYLVGDEKEGVVGLTGACKGGGIFDYTSEPHVGCHLVLG